MDELEFNTARVDEAVLALMYLTLHDADKPSGTARAWKAFDWDAQDRLHAQKLIENPVGKAKSVLLTAQGVRQSRALFEKLFARP